MYLHQVKKTMTLIDTPIELVPIVVQNDQIPLLRYRVEKKMGFHHFICG